VREFEAHVRRFLDRVPAEILALEVDDVTRSARWHRALHEAGLAAIAYPRRFGGAGLTPVHQELFDRLASQRRLPVSRHGIGIGMVYPTLVEHGGDELRRKYLVPLLRGEDLWCQLYSEPGAGSDLASLQTRAVRDGDVFRVTGQKVWTSGAAEADLGIAIVRTNVDVPKHRGITMMVIDMRQPGVTVRPLRQMTGVSEFNEVFLDEVVVPVSDVVGDVDRGWRLAVALLHNERRSLGTGRGGRQPASFEWLVEAARDRGLTGDRLIRQELAWVHSANLILSWLKARSEASAEAGRGPGPEGSVGKLWRTRLGRRAAALGGRIVGPAAIAGPAGDGGFDRWSYVMCDAPGMSLGGGTDEIQRNTIGEKVLGLPREPSVDREVPFRDLLTGKHTPTGTP